MHYTYKNNDLVSITLDKQAILNNMNTHGTGQLQTATYGNGLPYRHTFDKAGRTIQQQRGTQTIAYRYDKNGNITQQGNTTYDYDKLNRLRAANDPQFKQITYHYDANGNRTTRTTKNDKTTYQYKTGTNQLVGINQQTIHYDNTGRRIDDGRFTYAYNARGRITSITNKTTKQTTSYQYRMDGLRVSKTTNNKTTYYLYSANQQLIGETDSNGNITKEYIWLGLMPLAVIENNNIYFIHTDHLATPRIVTDKNKQVVWQWRSTPFGKGEPIENGLTVNLRFPGQYFDKESGLHYNWWRYYQPGSGRYVTGDPLGLEGGINNYIYANSSPVLTFDYSGLWSTNAHNELLLRFSNMRGFSEAQLRGIQAGSAYADSIVQGNQLAIFSYIHATTSSAIPDKAEACKKANEFIDLWLDRYRNNTTVNIGGRPNTIQSNPYFQLGVALHTVMDSTSPAHVNFQHFDFGEIPSHGPDSVGPFNRPGSMEGLSDLLANPQLITETLNLMNNIYDGDSLDCSCYQ